MSKLNGDIRYMYHTKSTASVTVMETGSVYCEVRNEFLNTIYLYVRTNKDRVWLKQPATTNAQVQFRVSTCEKSGGRTGNGIGSSPITSVFSCSTIQPLLYTSFRLVILLSSGRAV